VKTKIVEAVQSKDYPGNWGKFLIGVLDHEWRHKSAVDTDSGLDWPLLRSVGLDWRSVWVHDLQTREGAFFRPGGLARADLQKHHIWVCVLFEPFLTWLYAHIHEHGELDLDAVPDLVELPDAPFALYGHRRSGELDYSEVVKRIGASWL
jgi:hypothetical protein